jgi:signal transduction histidine kinase
VPANSHPSGRKECLTVWLASNVVVHEPMPAALEAVVRQLLASAEPIAIGVGPTLDAFHNTAFAAAIGVELSSPTGKSTLRDLCAGLWPRVAGAIDRALTYGEPTVLEDLLFCRFRNGCSEEAYLRFACGPLMDPAGTSAGVVVTVADTTDRVITDRRGAALQAIASAAAPKCTVREVCERALAALDQHPSDLPFALLYILSDESCPEGTLRLAATTSALTAGAPASPILIDADEPPSAHGWPAAAAAQTRKTVVVEDLLNRFGTLPGGDWPISPRCAVVVPVVLPGSDASFGVLICGVSARHPLNGAYRTFIDLLANQIGAAIAVGRAYEESERNARARAAARVAREKRRARLRALRAKFEGALEERTRLARELHDTLLQDVTGIALLLRTVLPEVRRAPESAASTLEHILELAEGTSREARQAVWNIGPTGRSSRSLAHALEMVACRILASTSIQLRVSVNGRARHIAAERQSTIVRIVQEATANAVRHAEARVISLTVVYQADGVRIEIGDDGRGFTVEPDLNAYRGHWGLVGMSERAHSLGGSLTVRSAVGRGTTVSLVVPRTGTPRRRTKVIG